MPISHLAVCRPVASARLVFCLASLVSIALVAAAAGGIALWQHARFVGTEHVLAPAGIFLLASAAVQLRIAMTWWRGARRIPHANVFPLLVSGAFVAYLAALAIGPREHIAWAWLAAVSVWHTVLLLPFVAAPQFIEGWRRWTQAHGKRRLSWLIAASILTVVCSEAALRIQKHAVENRRISGTAIGNAEANLRMNTDLAPHTVAMNPSAAASSGAFRVAVLGVRPALRQARQDDYLARVEYTLPGLKITPLDAPAGLSSHDGAELAHRLSACEADLVLVVMPLCEDLTQERLAANLFDWRQLELLQRWIGGEPRSKTAVASSSSDRGDQFEAFLRDLGPQLAACRTPLDDTMRAGWDRAIQQLDMVLESCRARRLPAALVLVPGQFQVDPSLCATLARRTGCPSERLDLELPQRRMTGFANHRNLPVLDLLPHLKLCRQSPYEPNAQRWNEHGHIAAASAISGWLESRYGGQLASNAQLSGNP